MSRIIDETNNRYGRLTVINQTGLNKKKQALWLCKCDCGNFCIVNGIDLRRGHTRSCGCLMKETSRKVLEKCGLIKKLPRDVIEYRRILSDIKRTAKRRNLEYSLSDEEVLNLVKQPCYYCEAEPRAHNNYDLLFNGIDRVDNNKGYIKGNVVSCCTQCNTTKNTLSVTEFEEYINRVYEHLKKIKKGGE